ncbi:hypothetical protein CDD80_5005 [Ophiocordyceps camponoti-rufipedis]|uniref:Uncharacterized protein n=1 Tax=Ophiocordyceps camponoti-rufipedis TaxID=2004952 RepID=A0A2C5YWN9_9HYPO|nr:hypothetical protein CDD80_5005 [Ophiocordyceps camponoti-rufipedis]
MIILGRERGLPRPVQAAVSKVESILSILGSNYVVLFPWPTRLRLYVRLIARDLSGFKGAMPQQKGRRIPLLAGKEDLLDARTGLPYLGNRIRTNRFTMVSFFPRQAWALAKRVHLVWFWVLFGLRLRLPATGAGLWNTLGPLIVYTCFFMAKDALKDYFRYQLDSEENGSRAFVLVRGCHGEKETTEDWLAVRWSKIRVGDVVRLLRNDAVPADLVLLHATGPEGVAYIDTMALDGEANLKPKQVPQLLAERCATVAGIRTADAVFTSEDPNFDLYRYEGMVTVGGTTLPLSQSNVIYRGSTLRNTGQAVGLVINSGEECKIRVSARDFIRDKTSALTLAVQKKMVFQISIALCLLVLLMCANLEWRDRYSRKLLNQGGLIGSFKNRNGTIGSFKNRNGSIDSLKNWDGLIDSLKKRDSPIDSFKSRDDLIDSFKNRNGTIDSSKNRNSTNDLFKNWDNSFKDRDSPIDLFEETILRHFLMLAELIPMSLYVAIQFIRWGQTLFMHDVEMYDPVTDTPMKVNTDSILEDLGQVTHVFSDKTGTMTENSMHFRKMTVGGVACLHLPDKEADDGGASEMKTDVLMDYIGCHPDTAFSRKARHLLLCMALCHTCLLETTSQRRVKFLATSPDELALVEAARDLGLVLTKRSEKEMLIRRGDDGSVETYQVLDVIEFSSARKRMSIVVRMPDGRIHIICKGADAAMTERLALREAAEEKAKQIGQRNNQRKTMELERERQRMRTSDLDRDRERSRRRTFELSWRGTRERSRERRKTFELGRMSSRAAEKRRRPTEADETLAADDEAVLGRCLEHVDDFSTEGLRTLIYASRTSPVERQQRVEEVGSQLETDLELVGATAIEDKLQQGVAETVDQLRRAGMKVWMLTGDKRETAINIGNAAGLCKPSSDVLMLDGPASVAAALRDARPGPPLAPTVLVLDGRTLSALQTASDGDFVASQFGELICRVDSIIFCRATPPQKAALVEVVRKQLPKSLTLAMGDGANDVGMLEAAHVGVGISGREGLQAARVSDFSIGQFRFLARLLLVHGRWNYMRTSRFILEAYWKEAFVITLQVWYQISCVGATNTSLFENFSLMFYGLLMTGPSLIIPAVLDRDLSARTLLAKPELYRSGPACRAFNRYLYVGWTVMGWLSSVVLFQVIWGAFQGTLVDDAGTIFAYGHAHFVVVVIFLNLKLLVLHCYRVTIINLYTFILAVGTLWIVTAATASKFEHKIEPFQMRGSREHVFGRLRWWAAVVGGIVALVTMDLAVQVLRRVLFPSDLDEEMRIEREEGGEEELGGEEREGRGGMGLGVVALLRGGRG